MKGYKLSPEHKAKISAALKGRPHTAEHNARVGAASKGRIIINRFHWPKGKPRSPQVAEMLRTLRLGKKNPPEHNARISAALRGRKASDEHRVNNSKSHLGKVPWNRGIPMREESKVKLAESAAKNHEKGSYLYRMGRPTCLELSLRRLLQGAGFCIKEQVRFGRYVVDAYDPVHNIAWEADGSFWYSHQDKEGEKRRDEYLLGRGVSAVIHLTDTDLVAV